MCRFRPFFINFITQQQYTPNDLMKITLELFVISHTSCTWRKEDYPGLDKREKPIQLVSSSFSIPETFSHPQWFRGHWIHVDFSFNRLRSIPFLPASVPSVGFWKHLSQRKINGLSIIVLHHPLRAHYKELFGYKPCLASKFRCSATWLAQNTTAEPVFLQEV